MPVRRASTSPMPTAPRHGRRCERGGPRTPSRRSDHARISGSPTARWTSCPLRPRSSPPRRCRPRPTWWRTRRSVSRARAPSTSCPRRPGRARWNVCGPSDARCCGRSRGHPRWVSSRCSTTIRRPGRSGGRGGRRESTRRRSGPRQQRYETGYAMSFSRTGWRRADVPALLRDAGDALCRSDADPLRQAVLVLPGFLTTDQSTGANPSAWCGDATGSGALGADGVGDRRMPGQPMAHSADLPGLRGSRERRTGRHPA